MEFPLLITVIVFLSLNAIIARTEEFSKSDELTLRNQLLADVYFLKEGVERLLISSEILNNRFNNQMDILKKLQDNKIIDKNLEFEEDKYNCDKITGLLNVTLKKQNILESRLFIKLDEMQDDQMTRFEEILLKQKLNKNCGSQAVSSTLTTTLKEVGEKIDRFEEKITKLSMLDEIINEQQKNFVNFGESQMKILQQINDKLNKREEQFDKINRELTALKEHNKDFEKVFTHPRPKLPMEVILGMTTANLTNRV